MSIFHIRTSPQLSGNGDKYQGASRLAFFFGIICLKGANMYLFYIYFRSWKKVMEFRRRAAAYREITNQK